MPWHWAEQSGPDCPPVMPDWILSGGDLGRGNDLASIVMTQLFTDKRADGQRGWWGNQFMPFEIGSELWRLQGQPATQKAAIDAERYVQEALDPLAKQGLFETYSVSATLIGNKLSMTVDLQSSQGVSLFTRELVI
jgi:phage gp46-like protein